MTGKLNKDLDSRSLPLLLVLGMYIALNILNVIAGDTVILSDSYVNDTLLISKHGVHIGTYPSLPVPSRCQIRRCLRNNQNAKDYHEYCFTGNCHYGEYHCVSGQGTIVHFCAKFDDCRPLHRHIPVFNKTTNQIEVFEVPCELGYFQRNEQHSCFPACVKDESRGFYDQGEGLPKQAYCVPSSHRCNVYGKMFFYPDTPDDDCSGKPRCKENEDPLPDCSCEVKCSQGETRQPSTRFKCTEINSVVEPDPSSALENVISTTPRKVLTDADEDTSHKVQDESYHEVNEEESPNDDNINSRSNEGNHITAIVITCAICLSLAAGLGVVVYIIYRRRRIDRRNDNNERLQSSSTGSLGPVENRFVEGSEAVEPEFAPEDASSSLGVRMNELKDCQCSSLLARSQTDLKEEISSQPV